MPVKFPHVGNDSIPIPGAYALLTTDDFFSNDSFFNPQTRTEMWYYTVIGLYSASPFVPAVLFTTQEGTVNTNNNGTDEPETATGTYTVIVPE